MLTRLASRLADRSMIVMLCAAALCAASCKKADKPPGGGGSSGDGTASGGSGGATGGGGGNKLVVGVMSDMSGLYADLAGPGSVVAAQMAVDEVGGKVGDMPIEIVSGD